MTVARRWKREDDGLGQAPVSTCILHARWLTWHQTRTRARRASAWASRCGCARHTTAALGGPMHNARAIAQPLLPLHALRPRCMSSARSAGSRSSRRLLPGCAVKTLRDTARRARSPQSNLGDSEALRCRLRVRTSTGGMYRVPWARARYPGEPFMG